MPLALAATLALGQWAGSGARAQDEEPQDKTVGLTFRVADHGSAGNHVEEFHKRVERDQWPRAVSHLQALLDLPPERGLVVRIVGSEPPRYEGVTLRARRLFDELPQAGRTAWEELSRARAEKLLDRGLRTRRKEDLRAVARRFPARDLLRRAHDALARLYVAEGSFPRAAYHLRKLLDVAEPAERPELFARLAFARAQAGDREGTDRVVEIAADLLLEPVPGPEGEEPLGRFLERMADAAGTRGRNSGWPQFGGGRHGTGLSEAPPELDPTGDAASPEWEADPGFRDGEENSLAPGRHAGFDPLAPAIAQGTLFVNNGLHVRAIDLSTGGTRWRSVQPCPRPMWRDTLGAVHGVAVADGVVYAPLPTRWDKPLENPHFFSRRIAYDLVHRALFALDARTGEAIWSHDDEQLAGRPDAAAMTRESVASPPLVVGDDVYVATWTFEGSYLVHLVCFDRHTGATRWRRSLVQGQQELNLFGRPVKELATTGLAELDGRIYLATGLGIAAAVDATDGEVLWLSNYRQVPPARSWAWYETRDRDVSWWPSPVAATRRAIVMAPQDSPLLLALDPQDGSPLWARSFRRHPNEYSWFLGIANERAYVLGTRLQCYDLEDGEPVWTEENAGRLVTARLKARGAAGRGLLTGDRVYVPVTGATGSGAGGAVVEMDAHSGAALDVRWIKTPGDLVSGDGTLLVVAQDFVNAYFDLAGVRKRLLGRLRDNPDDAQLRLEAGEIFRAAGELEEAVASLERGLELTQGLAARARDRLERPLRRSLYLAYVVRARRRVAAGDFLGFLDDMDRAVKVTRERGAAVAALFETAVVSADPAPSRAEFALRRIVDEYGEVYTDLGDGVRALAGPLAMFRLGGMAEARGDAATAAAVWLDLLERHPDADLGNMDARGAVRQALTALESRHGNVVTDAVSERARVAFERARQVRDVEALTRIARLYPDPEVSARAGLLAADLHLDAKRDREAAEVLQRLLRDGADDERKALALWRLSHAYRGLGALALERKALVRLAEETPDVVLVESERAEAVARRTLAEERFRAPVRTLPEVPTPLGLLWDREVDRDFLMVSEIQGATPAELDGRLLLADRDGIEVVDAATGTPVWRRPLPFSVRFVAGTGTGLVVVGSDSRARDDTVVLSAHDPSDGHELWKRSLPGTFEAATEHVGVLYLLRSTAARDVRSLVSAYDLGTGDVLGERPFVRRLWTTFTVTEDAVVLRQIPERIGRENRVVVTLDGTTLAPRGRTQLSPTNLDGLTTGLPGEPIVVTLDDERTLIGVDTTNGAEAWRFTLPQPAPPARRRVRGLLGTRSGVVVKDSSGFLRLVDASGQQIWENQPAEGGSLRVNSEAAAEDLLVAISIVTQGKLRINTAVAYRISDGTELWRVALPGEGSHLRPVICANVVAFEVTEWVQDENRPRSRLVLLDRRTGALLQEVRHPRVSNHMQLVRYEDGVVTMTSSGGLAVYGGR